MPHGLVTRISARRSPSKSFTVSSRLSAVLSSQPPKRVPFGCIMGAVSVAPDSFSSPMPHGLVTRISARPSPSKSPAGRNELSAVLSSQPPKRVPFGAIIDMLNVEPLSFMIPMPHGLDTRISARPSSSKSPTGPNVLSAVLSSQPPKRVPFGAIIGTLIVAPLSLNTPMPHGLVTRISARPSPSKSPTGPNVLSAVLSSQPPKRVPFGAIIGAVIVAPDSFHTPMPHGLETRISVRWSPSKSPDGPSELSAVLSSQPPKRVPFGAIIGTLKPAAFCSRTPTPHGLDSRISARPSPS